jgi:formylglycine-generating enzyme required for sulfatase activity
MCQLPVMRWDAARFAIATWQTAPVGKFAPNLFGLYDMVGNVQLWVEDCYHKGYDDAPIDGSASTTGDCDLRVARGGHWGNLPRILLSAARSEFDPGYRSRYLGFRVGRTLSARTGTITVAPGAH